MIKRIITTLFFIISLNANEDLTAQKQNTLYVQNLIEREETIAKNFEKYILTEFSIPTMTNLIDDNYLGSNFSVENRMGIDIDFSNTKTLKLKYLITKNEYNNTQDYVVQLYNRDLYRNYTSVYYEEDTANKKVNLTNSYIEMKLQSDEAKTVFDLLKNDKVIQKDCSLPVAGTYCSNNKKAIRWYNANLQWIEYSKKDFNKGNVILSTNSLLTDAKLQDLAVGVYIFIDGIKYVKLINDSSNNLQILKVN
jgi:hypothetical protein